MRLPTAERNAGADFWLGRINAGAAAGSIRVYTNDTRTTLLATLPLNDPGHTAAGVQGNAGIGTQPATPGVAWLDITSAAVEDPTPGNAGTAGFCDIIDSNANVRQEGSPGLIGSGSFVELSSLSIQTTVPVVATNGAITVPAGSL